MKRNLYKNFIIMILMITFLSACSKENDNQISDDKEYYPIEEKILDIDDNLNDDVILVEEELEEDDDMQVYSTNYKAGDNEVYIEVFKSKRILKLYKGSELINEYKIGLGSSPEGHKVKEGDGKTPEGEYYVCVKNPNSRFYLSLGLSYPNIKDASKGLEDGLISNEEFEQIERAINNKSIPSWYTSLGGEIMIHGHGSDRDWTAGCVALDDNVMDVLWEYCKEGSKVFIYK
ncbi:MAG TPA: L,D-transpeptidase family protein [Clostridiales bacterium]|nr:L,D-transpeptidase family protein [Clostridiales bacterium]